jgi:hypothetical protein
MVLDMINFGAVMIEVMIAHCKRKLVCPNHEKICAKMKAAGYQKYEGIVHASDVYVHPRSHYQMP